MILLNATAATALCLWLGAAPGPARAHEVTATASGPALLPAIAERVVLGPVGARSLRVIPLRKQVELELQGDAKSLAAAARALTRKSRLCPKAEAKGGRLILRCGTGRIEARLTPREAPRFLDLSESRGFPLIAGREGLGIPAISWWKPNEVPGCSLGPQQEGSACAAATEPPDLPEVWLEFGDMAASQGDGLAALAFYRKVWGQGFWLRAARARICELTSECLGTLAESSTFDARAMPEPQRSDMERRWLRVLAISDRMPELATALLDRLSDKGRESFCKGEQADQFCRELVLAALESPTVPRHVALQAYLALPDRMHGYRVAELVRTAAEAAVSLGAPSFAAALLAGVTPEVSEENLEPHLRRTAEVYALAGDELRRQVIVEFAKSRFGAKQVRGATWGVPPGMRASMLTASSEELKPVRPELEAEVASARELADALLAQSKARANAKRAQR